MTVSRRSLAVLCTAVTLVSASAAGAHILPQPTFVAQGAPTTISLAVPNERAPHSTVGVVVTLPRRFTIDSTPPTDGWDVTTEGRTVTWAGGPLRGTETATFHIELQTDAEPGPVTLEAVQRYDDGRSVDWKVPLSVVPGQLGTEAGSDGGGSWVIPIAVLVLVVAGSIVALVLVRRRRQT